MNILIPYVFSGMPVQVSRYLCVNEFVRWKRSHRKKRIRKKWRKYGAITACKADSVYRIGRTLTMCPCFYRKFLEHFTKEPHA